MRYKDLLVRGGYKLISDEEYDEVFNNRTFRIPKNCKFACKRVNIILYYEFIIFNPVN